MHWFLQRNRDKATRNITSLNVARYFQYAGRISLQAVPLLQARGHIQPGHVLLQHPAINNEQYCQYALKQADYSMRLAQQFRLLETPVLGPVFTQATPLGNMTSALIGQQERASIMTGAVITYASTAAAAYSQARGVDLGAGTDFMLVSLKERDLLLACRSAPNTQRAVAAAMAAAAGGARPAPPLPAVANAGSTAAAADGEFGHRAAADAAASAQASRATPAAGSIATAQVRECSPAAANAGGAQAMRTPSAAASAPARMTAHAQGSHAPAAADAGSAQARDAPAAAQAGERSSTATPAAAAVGLAQGDDGHATPPSSGGPGVTPVTAGQLHVDGDYGAKQVKLEAHRSCNTYGGAGRSVVEQPQLRTNLLSVLPLDLECTQAVYVTVRPHCLVQMQYTLQT